MKNKFYMIDLDGTMYLGTKRIKGAKTFIDYLLNNNIDFIFLTNNSCRTQIQAANHMLKMGCFILVQWLLVIILLGLILQKEKLILLVKRECMKP